MKPFALTLAALLLYVGIYYATVEPTLDPWHGTVTYPTYFPPFAERIPVSVLDRIDRIAGVVFIPVHTIDRRLRPATWE